MITTNRESWDGLKVRPNFMIIGAAKCGTSSLWAYLNGHPEVYLSRNKEPNYFAFAGASLPEPGPRPPAVMQELLYSYSTTDFDSYAALFQGANGAKSVGEASVRYLYCTGAAERIQAALPDIRLIVMLRDPVRRLYSHYCMNRRYGLEPLGLIDAVKAEESRKNAGWGYDWHYLSVGRYASQLARYLELFPRDRIGIFLYEDFARDTVGVFQDVCRFLGVNDAYTPDISVREKEACRPRSLALDGWLNPPGSRGAKHKADRLALLPGFARRRLISGLDWFNRGAVEKLRSNEHRMLRERLQDDIAKTSKILGKALPW